MPDTPIDQSAGIQSIRLKIPTGTVPVPPEGYAQLHSPSPGTLALRLPDGSVVPVGGVGVETTLENERGLVTVEQVGEQDYAVTIYAKPESSGKIQLAGTLWDVVGDPINAIKAKPVLVSSAEVLALHTTPKVLVAAPGAGKVVVPLHVTIRSAPGASLYTDPGGGDGYLRLGSLNLTSWQPYNILPSLVPQLSDWASGLWTPILADLVDVVNTPLTLTLTGGAWTGGDGALTVVTVYLVV